MNLDIIPFEAIERRIHVFRDQRVMLSGDLAMLYQVEPKVLIQAVKRNIRRFPPDFMFQLDKNEWTNLRSQNVTSSWGGIRTAPYAFTEQGVAMLATVLKSDRATSVSIEIMRAFVRLRRMALSHTELSARLDQLEDRYDEHFKVVFEAIRHLMSPPIPERRPIGFRPEGSE